jgi:hypothetical protein
MRADSSPETNSTDLERCYFFQKLDIATERLICDGQGIVVHCGWKKFFELADVRTYSRVVRIC